ncbi:K02A2.6-like, partial [Cordylochernes scorpioides]
MASYQFKEYNEETETFETFYERLEQFLILEEAGDEKKKAYLLTLMGSKTYGVLKNLCSPILPKDKTFDNLIDILKRHFSPKRSIVVERFIFLKRMQLKEESISDYLVEIKRLASSCNFGNFLEDSLRDKMVCGLYNAKIQNRILSEGDISLAKVIEIALSMEAAEKNTKLFHLEQGEDCVDKLRMERKVESNFQNGKCKHCGKQHKELCRFKEAICFKCNKKGHIASICWSSRRNLRQHQNQPGNIHQIGDQEEEDEYVQKIISVTIPEYKINFASSDPPYLMELKVEGNFIKFEMDTGSGLTLISEKDFKNSLQHLKLEKASIIVRTYDGTVVPILGKINVKVECQDITYKLRALVVKGEKRALMGREWINRLKLGCFAVKHMPVEITIEEILKENQALFVETTEPIKGFTFSVNMCDVNPIFHKARPVPFAIRPAVTEALDKMVAKGYLCEVASSKWATPVVVVPKKNKEIRICCDFKVTLNKYLDTAAYPLPTQQDLFSTLAKGKYFSKLDLRNAYLQLEVDPGTRPLLTINTHKGLFRFKRMPFGLANAPSYFQSVMDRVLSGIGGVICYIDDVLIATASIEEHLALLKTIFARLAKYNIKLKKEKCLFLQKEIEYLGHLVTGEGIRPLDHKVQAIQKAKTPTNISELRSFLGLVNFYGKFIPNLPELLKPLHELLHKKRPWVWTKECGEAIDKCKNSITSERVLVPYDTTLPLCLATDASQIGVGAVLSHIIEGQERPIMFASRTLSGAEQNYSQIEKEALAIIYGVTKFHQFIYGRKFILITDHKPLVTILGPKSGIPTLSTSRLQRWALILSAYTYDIKFRRTQDHGNADLLSRFPVGCEEIPRLNNVYALSFVEELPITAEEIATETEKDEVLSLAKFYTQQGWPEKVADHLRPYFQRKLELTVDGECLVWGMRVVIPPSLRIKMLNCLHETHSGMNRMKAVARSHFWWPNLDTQIEFLVNKCRSCQQSQDGPNKGKWQPWKWSTRPWQRIHIDFANKENINLLIVVDSHSKWIEAIPMRETTTRKTIEQLRRLFSSYGLPEELVSDNGPQFTGSEMKGFLEGNGIKQTLIPAYHPQSNGLAERAVRTIKTALDKNKRKIGDTIQDTLSKVLLAYRSTPHVTTGKTPSELFIGRALRTRVSLIHPSLASRVRDQQARQMKYDRRTHLEEFQIDDLVWCKNFRGGDKWIPGKIVGKKGTRVYTILIHGQVKAYHRDQIRKRWRNGEEDESGDGERQPEHSRGAGPSAIISEVVRDRGYMESLSPGLTSQRSDQDSEVQSDTDDGKSLEPLRSLDPEALKEEGPVLRRNPPRARRPPIVLRFMLWSYLLVPFRTIWHGTPETVRSDNGPQFQKVLCSEFSRFSKEWSFKNITSSPRFPQSNGFIEAIIKNIKQSLKKEEDCYLTLQAYRTMTLENGYSPAELLMGRRLRTSVPGIESSLMSRYLDTKALQEREKRRMINQKRLYDKRHDVHSLPQLQQGDRVWIRDQRVEGKVLHKSKEPRSYWVQTPQGKEYNEETETFETFYERLEQFLILEEAGDEKKKAYLLTLMGSKTYGVLKNLCSPILPKDKTFDNLIDILKRHFSPKRSIVVERFIFFKRMQLKEESISDYLVEIKRLASSCNFGNFLEDSLRDKMVCGLYNAKIQNRILSEGDISLAKVIEIALSMEAAEKNTKLFHLEQGEDCVDKLRMERKVESNFQNGKCKHCASIIVRTYDGTVVPILGKINVKVECQDITYKLRALVVKGEKRALMGREWINRLKLGCFAVKHMPVEITIEEILKENQALFVETTEPIKGFTFSVNMCDVNPIFHKARPVPFAIRPAVTEALDKMVAKGYLCEVASSKWATPVVVVPKKNKEIRICCDFKVTLNKYLDTAAYPLPTQQDLFSTLAKGKYFSKLDLRNAYLQLEVDPGTRPLLTINTHKGLFRFKRMPFGLANAPSYFQSVMDRVLSGIGGVICYIDDVLIATASIEEHLALLKTIFARLAKYNIKLKKEKCLFLQKEIEYLGHLVTEEGIRPLDHKVQAIQKAKTPTNISELRSFLGLVNFYGKFIPNLPELLKPLHELLHKKRPWVWTKECGEAIDKCKNSITSERVLVPYDATLPLCLATDASQIGVGAVLSHIIEGQERPIMFASRTLSVAEQNYSQIEKEALAIIYGVTKFHQFIYGRKFILITDHKPLVTILGSRSGIPTLSTSRLQRWALILSAYTYDIKFRRTQDHGNTDLLSRFPVGCEEIPRLNNVYALSYVEELPITAEEIAKETEKDEVLSLAKFYTQQGWPEKVADHLRPYFQRKLELTVDGECLVWGMRVVIPPSLRIKMLNCLHQTHSGMYKMKAVARSHFWWPNLDTQIEFLVNECRSCQQSQDGPNKGKWQPWKWSTRPWQRIHIDFANKENINLLIVVDSHSKWIEAIPMRETTTRKTIEQLRRLFSSYGLPEELVSDNGPQFTGSEMKGFLEGNGNKQTLIPAYHPQSNGLAERAVRTIKTALDKNKRKIGDTHTPFKTPYQKFFWHIEAPR